MSKRNTTKAGTFTRSADDRFISIADAAGYLGVNQRTIRNMLADGRLIGHKLGDRVVRIKLSEIDAALQPYEPARVPALINRGGA